MQKLYISAFGLFVMVGLSAQKVIWQRDIASGTQDFLTNLTSTIDGQILVAGSSIRSGDSQVSADNSQNTGYDYHILKVDQQGQKLWEKYISGNQHDYLHAGVATREGGFLLAGTSYSTKALDKKDKSFGGSDMWLVKLDENGAEQWQRTIGTRGNEEARAAVQTMDLGYMIGGSTNHNKLSFGQKDVLVVKLDKEGNILHQQILGGSGLDEVETMIPTPDGGVLVGVYSRSPGYEGDIKAPIRYESFLKEQSNGSSHVSGRSGSSEVGSTNGNLTTNSNSVNTSGRTSDNSGNHLNNSSNNPSNNSSNNPSTGNSRSAKASEQDSEIDFYAKSSESFGDGDYWIVKLDKNGKVEWEKTFGGKEDDHIRSLSLTDSGYMVAGESRSSVSGNKKATVKEGTDLWLVALSENGEEQWQKSYSFGNRDILMSLNTIKDSSGKNPDSTKGFLVGGYTQSEGEKKKDDETFWMLYVDAKGEEVWRKYVEGASKKNQERLSSAVLTRDGSYILAGTSAEELGKENWKIVKLKDPQVEDLMDNRNIQIYPNPVGSYCYVEIGVAFSEADLFIYDMTGRLIRQTKTRNSITKLSTGSLPQGAYIIKAQTNNPQKQVLSTKIIKE